MKGEDKLLVCSTPADAIHSSYPVEDILKDIFYCRHYFPLTFLTIWWEQDYVHAK
jgi:hypothetical protein